MESLKAHRDGYREYSNLFDGMGGALDDRQHGARRAGEEEEATRVNSKAERECHSTFAPSCRFEVGNMGTVAWRRFSDFNASLARFATVVKKGLFELDIQLKDHHNTDVLDLFISILPQS